MLAQLVLLPLGGAWHALPRPVFISLHFFFDVLPYAAASERKSLEAYLLQCCIMVANQETNCKDVLQRRSSS